MIITPRLELVPATLELTQAALESQHALATRLGVTVPATWPPDFLDPPSLQFTVERLQEGPEQLGWWLHFVVLAGNTSGRILIGSAGYKGPPSGGAVEIGYGIVRDYQRRGYASEAVHGLLAQAFATPVVQRVIAETLPELTPSIGVLRKCGFEFIGEGSEPGVIRFRITRAAYASGGGAV